MIYLFSIRAHTVVETVHRIYVIISFSANWLFGLGVHMEPVSFLGWGLWALTLPAPRPVPPRQPAQYAFFAVWLKIDGCSAQSWISLTVHNRHYHWFRTCFHLNFAIRASYSGSWRLSSSTNTPSSTCRMVYSTHLLIVLNGKNLQFYSNCAMKTTQSVLEGSRLQ